MKGTGMDKTVIAKGVTVTEHARVIAHSDVTVGNFARIARIYAECKKSGVA